MKTLATLDIRRHLYKASQKDAEGNTRIDIEKSGPLADKVAAEYLGTSGTLQIGICFYGTEVRTQETVQMVEDRLEYRPMDGGVIDETGGDEWTLKYAFTKAMQAELKEKGRKDYLRFLIEKVGRQNAIQMALYAVAGIYKMFQIMAQKGTTSGLAIGHSPDMLMFVAWAMAGFPEDLSTLDHGDGNLPEGEGYRIALMEDGTLRLVEHLTF